MRVAEAGIDTFKFASYLADDRSLRALRQPGLTTKPASGGAQLVRWRDGADWPVPGVRALFYAATSLLAIEGHPSGARGALASADDVPQWVEDVRDELHLHGVRLDDRLGVARCDAAVSIDTTPVEGRALLAGAAAIVPPRLKVETYRSQRAIETVYYVTERGAKRARWYDSATAYETAAPLTTIRAEDQRRYDRPARRLDARTVTTANVRHAFRERWSVLSRATRGVTVATLPVLVDKLGVMVEQDELTIARAEQAVGFTVLAGSGLAFPERTARRRRRMLRELGLVQLEGELEPVEVDMGAAVDAICDGAVW